METVCVMPGGRVTILTAIRKRLNLKTGDKICFIEQDGRVRIENAAVYAFEKIQKDFTGEADRLGLNTIDDVVVLVKEVRLERDGK